MIRSSILSIFVLHATLTSADLPRPQNRTLAVEDWASFCESGGDFECLPRIQDVLGIGVNGITGTTTYRLVELNFRQPKLFLHSILGSRYIPGNVECADVTRITRTSVVQSFASSIDYRRSLALRHGLTFPFRKVLFSADSRFQRVVKTEFRQQKAFIEASAYQTLYKCWLQAPGNAALTPYAQEVARERQGADIVEHLGSHVVTSATFGGLALLRGSTESCILKTLSLNSIQAEVNAYFWDLVGLSIGQRQRSEMECNVFYQRTEFERQLVGGDAATFSSRQINNWYNSIARKPAPIEIKISETPSIVPQITADGYEEYFERFKNPGETRVDVSTLCQNACSSASSHGILTSFILLVALFSVCTLA